MILHYFISSCEQSLVWAKGLMTVLPLTVQNQRAIAKDYLLPTCETKVFVLEEPETSLFVCYLPSEPFGS
ncbi:hypothetical protein Gasu2_04560 [Galdieria sulphuraria]|nr:hypothetical protein Gasu2_04560 [Galdieria sulphuraria]